MMKMGNTGLEATLTSNESIHDNNTVMLFSREEGNVKVLTLRVTAVVCYPDKAGTGDRNEANFAHTMAGSNRCVYDILAIRGSYHQLEPIYIDQITI